MATTSATQAQQQGARTKAFRYWRRVLLIFCIFVGVGALFGGVGGYVAPDFFGASMVIPMLREIPFVGLYINSYMIPASALLLFVFVPQTIATIRLLRRHPKQFSAAIVCGILLAVFTIVELIFLPNALSWVYLSFGAIEIALAVVCSKKTQR